MIHLPGDANSIINGKPILITLKIEDSGVYSVLINIKWICENNHRWEAIPNNIQQGTSLCNVKIDTWCPFCYKYKHEQLCQEIVTKYFDSPSENRRPDFLKTPEHPIGLELDIYYPDYGFSIKVQA
ncbi:hypothetical protein Glove_726g4 [Diversispora epigaea]|uniref:Uncharacterized protein n=1 Tax=Diversispora epigaea TaxID=1348612 RepID=A0A397G0D1_9GLOM|nr:hypothetical protein Glove_812864g3 [Diversispora epigaea]RHZ44427.1 hypothetical protein Glove_726g4 [Diversispora epigaea]